jgi:hypothetical protein
VSRRIQYCPAFTQIAASIAAVTSAGTKFNIRTYTHTAPARQFFFLERPPLLPSHYREFFYLVLVLSPGTQEKKFVGICANTELRTVLCCVPCWYHSAHLHVSSANRCAVPDVSWETVRRPRKPGEMCIVDLTIRTACAVS